MAETLPYMARDATVARDAALHAMYNIRDSHVPLIGFLPDFQSTNHYD